MKSPDDFGPLGRAYARLTFPAPPAQRRKAALLQCVALGCAAVLAFEAFRHFIN